MACRWITLRGGLNALLSGFQPFQALNGCYSKLGICSAGLHLPGLYISNCSGRNTHSDARDEKPKRDSNPWKAQNLCKNLVLLQKWGMSVNGLNEVKDYRKVSDLHSKVVDQKLRWLAGRFGLTQQESVKIVRGYPLVLGLSLDENVRTFMDIFQNEGVSRQDQKEMVLSCPQMLGRAKKFAHLQKVLEESVGLTGSEFVVMVVKYPQILLRTKVDDGVRCMVEALQQVGLDLESIGLMLKKFPLLLLMSLEEDIKPAVDRFQELGLSTEDLQAVLTGSPSLLQKDFDWMILAKLKFLEHDVGFERKQALGLLVKDPRKFRDDLRTWKETHQWMLSKGMSLSDARDFAEKNMHFLSRKFYGLDEKYDFATAVLGKKSHEILRCPRYFNASFEEVIMFRTALLRKMGVDYSQKALGHIVTSQGIFARRYGGQQLLEFQKYWGTLTRYQKVACFTEEQQIVG